MEKYNEKMKIYTIKSQKQQEKIHTYNSKLEGFAMKAQDCRVQENERLEKMKGHILEL